MGLNSMTTKEKFPEEKTLKEISALLGVIQSTPTNENFDKLWKKINQLLRDLKIDLDEITKDLSNLKKFFDEIGILVNYNPSEKKLKYANSQLLVDMTLDEKSWWGKITSTEMFKEISTLIDTMTEENKIEIEVDKNTIGNGEIDIIPAKKSEDNHITEKDIAETKESVVDKGDFMGTLKLIVEEEIPQMVKNEHERRSKHANMVQNQIRQSRKKISRTFENQPE